MVLGGVCGGGGGEAGSGSGEEEVSRWKMGGGMSKASTPPDPFCSGPLPRPQGHNEIGRAWENQITATPILIQWGVCVKDAAPIGNLIQDPAASCHSFAGCGAQWAKLVSPYAFSVPLP